MKRTLHPAPPSLASSLCCLLSYTLLVSLWAPFIVPRAAAAPLAEKQAAPATILTTPSSQSARRDGELLVRFRAGLSEQSKNALISSHGGRRIQRLHGSSRLEKIALAPGLEPESLAARLRLHPLVEMAEPNYLISRAEVIPSDPRFTKQWTLARHA